MFTDSSGFEETFCAMNRTKIQMFVKGWDCPKFFKTKEIYNNAISFLRRSLLMEVMELTFY